MLDQKHNSHVLHESSCNFSDELQSTISCSMLNPFTKGAWFRWNAFCARVPHVLERAAPYCGTAPHGPRRKRFNPVFASADVMMFGLSWCTNTFQDTFFKMCALDWPFGAVELVEDDYKYFEPTRAMLPTRDAAQTSLY